MLHLRRQRRAERLNRALHELRRPLQALVLLEHRRGAPAASASGGARRGLLELALCALDDLDAAVNEHERRPRPRRTSCRALLLASIERWRPLVGEAGLRLYWDAGPAVIEGDPSRVSRALDNLLANAIEHGGPPLVVTGAHVGDRLRITVANSAPAAGRNGGAAGTSSSPGTAVAGERHRRGHGISIVSEVARDHGGRFALYRSGQGCVAALELPLADLATAQAA